MWYVRTIPGEFIAFITFPGVIVHEIAHRFFCDINDIPVYEIRYFRFFSKVAGHITFQYTENLKHVFFISFGPIIINSLICILLTCPFGITYLLGTTFLISSPIYTLFYYLITWIGYSVGFHAIPSNKNMEHLAALAYLHSNNKLLKFIKIISFFNEDGIGPVLCGIYAFVISMILPSIIYLILLIT